MCEDRCEGCGALTVNGHYEGCKDASASTETLGSEVTHQPQALGETFNLEPVGNTERKVVALYERLPKLACKGLCKDSCGPIGMSAAEARRIVRETGEPLKNFTRNLECEYLKDGRCSIYELRPLICRMWGAVQGMPCIYGCEPEGGLMPDAEAMSLLDHATRLSGKPDVVQCPSFLPRQQGSAPQGQPSAEATQGNAANAEPEGGS